MHIRGIFCNLAMAFDYINHEILLPKLHAYGIQGISANWFKSFFNKYTQEV